LVMDCIPGYWRYIFTGQFIAIVFRISFL